MNIEYKILTFAISTVLISVLSVVLYNTYDSKRRVAAYDECVKSNERIALNAKYDSIYLHTCYMR